MIFVFFMLYSYLPSIFVAKSGSGHTCMWNVSKFGIVKILQESNLYGVLVLKKHYYHYYYYHIIQVWYNYSIKHNSVTFYGSDSMFWFSTCLKTGMHAFSCISCPKSLALGKLLGSSKTSSIWHRSDISVVQDKSDVSLWEYAGSVVRFRDFPLKIAGGLLGGF